ncbi:ABC-three component system protein [Herbaspirillum camelliae]
MTEPYVVRGGFHILANSRPLPRVYWHPRFLSRVGQLLGDAE